MADTIEFYYNPMSRGRIVHWMLEEVGATYEIKLINFQKGEHKDPKYLALNPMGKIPAIVHRGTVVTECAAICAYLADALPNAHLAPPTTEPKRGTYLRWLFFAASCVEQALADKAFPRIATARPSALGYGTYDDTMKALETAIAPGPFVLGSHFSAADVYLASQIGWGLTFKTIEPRASFNQYVARCQDRPAFKKSEKQANELMGTL